MCLKNQNLLTPKNIKMSYRTVVAHATCGSACAWKGENEGVAETSDILGVWIYFLKSEISWV